jgi:galactoside O-acetyltransferase
MDNPMNPGFYSSADLRTFGFARVGENVLVAKNCVIVGPENIEIGDNSRIDGFCNIIASGPLTIGERVHIHSYCQIGARGGVTFEDYSAIASGCLVYSASDDISGRHMIGGCVPGHLVKPKIAPVVFGRHSGAFARCTILAGVKFGEGAAACAHSLVTQDVPEWTIVAGSPARHRLNRSRRLLTLEATLAEIESIAA